MILCCGEALIDFLPRKTADGADAYQPFCGGSIYNTAIALGRLGVPVGTPLLQIERVALSMNGKRVEWRLSRCDTSTLVYDVTSS